MYVYKAFLKKVKRNSPLKFKKKGAIYKKTACRKHQNE